MIKSKITTEEVIESLTPKMIKEGNWKKKNFIEYDVSINVPKIFGGKRQPYVEFISETKT